MASMNITRPGVRTAFFLSPVLCPQMASHYPQLGVLSMKMVPSRWTFLSVYQ